MEKFNLIYISCFPFRLKHWRHAQADINSLSFTAPPLLLLASYCYTIVATADTRAEGKALRRALKLRVVTAEEVQTQVSEEEVLTAQDHINDQQIMAINAVCRKHDLNVEKVAKSVYNNAKTLKQLTNLEASVLMDKITSYQREKSIPEELLGYDASWQSSF